MAEKRRFLDVWIVETNTVYKEVPYTVVADWAQQGRLLEDDMIKPSGTKEWMRLGASPEFQPFLPHPDPLRAEDEAEAREPIVIDFGYKHPPAEDESDVDMIPLIDVSLVLLIFFMLTASAVGSAAFIATPATEQGLVANNPDTLRIDIDKKGDDPVYALGVADRPPEPEDRDLRTQAEVLDRLRARLARTPGTVELVINGHKDLKARFARDLLIALREDPFRSKISLNYFGVSEK
jgi:biopolymer transport protein ExbD